MAFKFHLHAAGALAPGIASFDELREVASGMATYSHSPLSLAAPSMLPSHERRRSSQAVRLVLSCIEQALQASPFPPESLRSVFASDEGTGEVCQQMLQALATTRQVSPLVFSNSVLNAPSGYFSIAWRNCEPATVVSLGLETFASGLLCAVIESVTSKVPVLFASYDPALAAPLAEVVPITESIATAWIISTQASNAPAVASLTLELRDVSPFRGCALPGWMPGHWAALSSAPGLAALATAVVGDSTVFEMTLGRQVLALSRSAGPA